MKKLIGIILIAASLAACNNKYKASSDERADSIKMMKDSLKLDSFKRAEVAKTEAKKEAAARPVIVNHYSTTQAAPVERKNGWSSAAKGAVIGGVAGAGAGALIDKNTGRGAIVGAAAGAGAGYLIGRGNDKKTGRAN